MEKFCHFLLHSDSSPITAGLPSNFQFLLSLAEGGLCHSSLCVYLAAISAFHKPVDGHSIFSHPVSKHLLRGLLHLYPPIKTPVPAWDLPLVFCCFPRQPFEPEATCDLCLLSFKTLSLLAITSPRKFSELSALWFQAPYISFLPHLIKLYPDNIFSPKVVSKFHLHLEEKWVAYL